MLETAGRWWAVERVASHRSLSNAYSIGRDPSRISQDFQRHADIAGWTDAGGRFDVADCLIDEARDQVSFGRGRCARGQALLDRKAPQLAPADMMAILRDHGEAPDWSPANTRNRTLCMHASAGPRRSQSVASMVSEISGGRAVHWVTGTSAPCTGIFKPVILEAGLPDIGSSPTDRHDDQSLWWRHERLHRAMLADFGPSLAGFEAERDALEADFRRRIDAAFATGADPTALRALTAACWREATGRWCCKKARSCWRAAPKKWLAAPHWQVFSVSEAPQGPPWGSSKVAKPHLLERRKRGIYHQRHHQDA